MKILIKKITKLFFILVFVFFYSCEEQTILEPKDIHSFIKEYTISRTNGDDYVLNYQTAKNVSANSLKTTEGVHTIKLSKQNNLPATKHKEIFPFTKKEIQISFVTEESMGSPIISIKDSNAGSKSSKNTETELLTSYAIINTHESIYQLDFEVPAEVSVSFNFNDHLQVYEVHLSQEASTNNGAQTYSHTYTATTEGLYIDFVNHYTTNGSSRTTASDRIPRIIIGELTN